MRDAIIETQGLSKDFGAQRALSDVTIRVPPGTIGLLGPNGAGKTTFLKCLLSFETATAGTARVLGRTIRPGTAAPASASAIVRSRTATSPAWRAVNT
ncbi:MAG: ATP-binding cassette domain-containing protein [Opitutaceae bacterium]|nr:ATP-binding cassette domain-containing protein [Opitutaceae bacterium]